MLTRDLVPDNLIVFLRSEWWTCFNQSYSKSDVIKPLECISMVGKNTSFQYVKSDSERMHTNLKGTGDFSHPYPDSATGWALFCQHGGFVRAVPLGVSGSAQFRSSGQFLLWAQPAASRRRRRGLLLQPGRRPRQPALLFLQPKPQPSAIHLQTQLRSVLPITFTNPSSHPPSKSWSHFLLSRFLKSVRCSVRRVSSATSSCWTVRAATPWAHHTTPRPPPGAAAPSPRPRCTHTTRPPSTPPASPPPSPSPETDTRLRAERAGRAPSFRRPWRPNVWAHRGGPGSAAVSWIWPLLLGVCMLHHPIPTHTCWAPTARTWQVHRNTILLPSTPTLDPGSTPHFHLHSTIRCGYPLQVRIH